MQVRWFTCLGSVFGLALGCSSSPGTTGTSAASLGNELSDSGELSESESASASGSASASESDGGESESESDGGETKFDMLVPDAGVNLPDESTCEAVADSLSSAGCQFAPSIANQNWTLPWAVVAANTNVNVATATLYSKDGVALESAMIEPGDAYVFEIEADSADLTGHQTPAQTGVSQTALELTSDIPIVAYQFTPFSSSQVAVADASLLLPVHAWDTDYYAAMYANDGTVWLEVISLSDDNQITITAPPGLLGSTNAGGGIPGLSAGQSTQAQLDSQEILRVVAPSGGVTDITGIRVQSTAPVSVLVGSPSMSIPGPGMSFYKDYLEESLPPASAWGEQYVAVKFRPRSDESDIYRFVADEDDTTIELTGDYSGELTLDAGEFAQVTTPEAFLASGDKPFMVAHLMVSQDQASGAKDEQMYPGEGQSGNCGWDGVTTQLGDPTMSYLVPVDQFRYNYTFLSPTTYAWDMITVTGSSGSWASIELDGAPLPDPTPLGVGNWVYARFLIEDGVHEIHGNQAFGIEVYGYDCRISYAYPGGLNLAKINPPEG